MAEKGHRPHGGNIGMKVTTPKSTPPLLQPHMGVAKSINKSGNPNSEKRGKQGRG